MNTVDRLEVERADGIPQILREGVGWATIDVLEQHRSGGGSVRLPQLIAMGSVDGREVERAINVRQGARRRAARARIDVLDHHCSGGGPVRSPELLPVVGGIEQGDPAADRRKIKDCVDSERATICVPKAVPSVTQSRETPPMT